MRQYKDKKGVALHVGQLRRWTMSSTLLQGLSHGKELPAHVLFLNIDLWILSLLLLCATFYVMKIYKYKPPFYFCSFKYTQIYEFSLKFINLLKSNIENEFFDFFCLKHHLPTLANIEIKHIFRWFRSI